MSNSTYPRRLAAKLGAPFAAAALALAAGAACAGTASVNITSFSVSTDGIAFVAPKFAWASDPLSSLTLEALDAGGLAGGDQAAYNADNWDPSSGLGAATVAAQAGGDIVTFTDVMTQLATGGFNLSAAATRVNFAPGLLPSTASALGLQTGGFTLLDGAGNATAGTIFFEIYYDIAVASTIGAAPNDYAQSLVSFSASDDEGNGYLSDALASFEQASGIGAKSGVFTMNFQLAAGEVVNYALGGDAFVAASPVPEPAPLALAALGLVGVVAAARRKVRTAR